MKTVKSLTFLFGIGVLVYFHYSFFFEFGYHPLVSISTSLMIAGLTVIIEHIKKSIIKITILTLLYSFSITTICLVRLGNLANYELNRGLIEKKQLINRDRKLDILEDEKNLKKYRNSIRWLQTHAKKNKDAKIRVFRAKINNIEKALKDKGSENIKVSILALIPKYLKIDVKYFNLAYSFLIGIIVELSVFFGGTIFGKSKKIKRFAQKKNM